MPDEGRDAISALHTRLDADLEIQNGGAPYVPHVTVAASPDFERCRALALELDSAQRIVHGALARIDVVTVTSERVTSIATIELSGG